MFNLKAAKWWRRCKGNNFTFTSTGLSVANAEKGYSKRFPAREDFWRTKTTRFLVAEVQRNKSWSDSWAFYSRRKFGTWINYEVFLKLICMQLVEKKSSFHLRSIFYIFQTVVDKTCSSQTNWKLNITFDEILNVSNKKLLIHVEVFIWRIYLWIHC